MSRQPIHHCAPLISRLSEHVDQEEGYEHCGEGRATIIGSKVEYISSHHCSLICLLTDISPSVI